MEDKKGYFVVWIGIEIVDDILVVFELGSLVRDFRKSYKSNRVFIIKELILIFTLKLGIYNIKVSKFV